MSDENISQYIKVDNEKIKRKAPGFASAKMIGLYAMLSAYLSNPEFEYCKGGLKTALIKRCTNQKLSFGRVWKALSDEGYLKRSRVPFYKNKFRDFYELLPMPDKDIPAIRNMTAAEGRTYIKNKPQFIIPKHNYTGISYNMLMDSRLSLFSKGLFCIIQRLILIAANKPELVITKELLSSNVSEGTTAFNNAWRQLKGCGYLELTRIYDTDLKRFRYLYKLNTSPYEYAEKRRAPALRAGEAITETETEIKPAPMIITETQQKYYTEDERKEYIRENGFEVWLPPAYTLDNIEKLREEIKYQMQYRWQIDFRRHNAAAVDMTVDILTETALLESRGRRELILKQTALHNLDCEDIDYALSSFEAALEQRKIVSKKKYLLSILFNAKDDMLLEPV